MKYKLIEIGRGKVNRTIEIKAVGQLVDEVSKHLLSSCVEIQFDDDTFTKGDVIVGGFRIVGKVEKIEDD